MLSQGKKSNRKWAVTIKNFRNVLKADFYRAFFSSGFLIGILSTIAIFYFGSIGMMSHNSSAVAAFNNIYKYNNISQLLILSATFAYTAGFSIDWQSRFTFSIIGRSNKISYILSKFASAAVSGGLSVALGAAIFVGFICMTQPNIMPTALEVEMEFSNQAFGDLLVKGKVVWFFFSYLYIVFFQAVFFSSLGLMVSGYLPNRYIAYISPFVLGFMLNQVANVLELPIWLDPVKLATASILGVTAPVILWTSTASFLSFTMICGALFVQAAKRRISNG